ncbi:MAG: hypothetical protein JJU02_00265 [Cryomorphaceae bacterium]|nr:hypothetical protein [Cryomorphaceae bacterium]
MNLHPDDILSVALDQISRWDDTDYDKNTQILLDEQPYLFRFVMNLVEDFQEEDIEFFILTLMSLQLGFKIRGIPLNISSAETIEKKVKSMVTRYDNIEYQEEISIDDIYASAENPKVLQQFFEIYMSDFLREERIGMAEVLNLLLVIEVIIGAVEECTMEPKPTNA